MRFFKRTEPNASSGRGCPIDGAPFNGSTSADSQKTSRDWWEFLDETEPGNLPGSYSKLIKGTRFRLHAKGLGGDVLWEMIHCRGGNLGGVADAKVNRLPFSKTAKRYGNRDSPCTMATTGNLIMQNVQGARLVSSCFPEGVGTVYFDAVNGFTGYTN